MDAIIRFLQDTGFYLFSQDGNWRCLIMLGIACVLLYLGIVKKFEPLLLVPIAFGMLITNLPGANMGAVDKVTFILVLTNKKDAHRRHPACFIIRFRFNAVADKRQWSSAASKPRRKTRAKLCSRFCAENEPSHQTCRSFSASR